MNVSRIRLSGVVRKRRDNLPQRSMSAGRLSGRQLLQSVLRVGLARET